ncbi:MAG: NAD(P)H-binding protein [Bacteriovoracaceae bacterium]|nr:NAD(P)H-binding protein [Bacteriovoracaceae bacterium]
MKIAIIGSTGLIGSELLKALLKNPNISKVISISRRQIDIDEEKLEQIVITDLNAKSLNELTIEADVFFCSLGTTIKVAGSKERFKEVDYDLVCAFGDLAKKSSASSLIVISAMGAKKDSFVFYNKVKGEMEEYIKGLELKSTYILRPSLLIGSRSEKRTSEELGIKTFNVLEPIMPKKLSLLIGTKVSSVVTCVENLMEKSADGFHVVSASEIT